MIEMNDTKVLEDMLFLLLRNILPVSTWDHMDRINNADSPKMV